MIYGFEGFFFTFSSELLSECEDIEVELSVSPGLRSEDFRFHQLFFSISLDL